ncbi:RadC family protein [Evansella clarkii]|uniref:RadC family protein n=1 Tax=Evansella clarkii TaxID=79879 RepID=UPI00099614BE|nr:DNA repair protein RadC [Evansella clarkii]
MANHQTDLLSKSKDDFILKDVRERVSVYGTEDVSIHDLLALIIGKNNKEAIDVLAATHPRELLNMSLSDFKAISGIGPVLAERLEACMGLAKKLLKENFPEQYVIRSPEDARQYLIGRMKHLIQEEFVVMVLNTKNHVLATKTIFKGTLNASIIHPREIFNFAIKKNGASIILAHNHPSGEVLPSPEDIEVTERLNEAGDVLGIDVLDHIIIGGNRYLSMQEKGYM